MGDIDMNGSLYLDTDYKNPFTYFIFIFVFVYVFGEWVA